MNNQNNQNKKRKSSASPRVAAKRKSVPSAIGYSLSNKFPRMNMGPNDSVILEQTELLLTHTSGTANAFFVSYGFSAPGKFPWLAGVAANFSKFRYLLLEYIYVPACSTSTAGRTAMALAYDPGDTAPTTVQQIISRQNAVSGPVWDEQRVKVDVQRFNSPWYNYCSSATYDVLVGGSTTTAAGLAQISALTARSPCVLLLGSDGVPATTTVGTLMVKYRIEMADPLPSASNI